MCRPVAALLMAFLPLMLHAQGDPLVSPECDAARAELDQALDGADSGAGQARERLARARTRVATACLGGSDGGRKRSGAPDPALQVPPALITNGRAHLPTQTPAQLSAPLPRLEGAPAPVAIPRPTVINTCDASGCWDSQGRRLNNAGPVLMGPRGLCSGTGNTVICP
ncbi:MAG TPA: hypothetical protein VKP68_04080 [Ramlibacter sp.]|nr:hypothetical protein [Ramlibacter sp.]